MKIPHSIPKLSLFIFLLLCLCPIGSLAAISNLSVYGNSLNVDWSNWSWDSTINLANTTPVHSASNSVSVKYTAAWAGLYLHSSVAVDTAVYDRLSFWMYGGSTSNQQIQIIANSNTVNAYPVTVAAGTWTQVVIPLSALGSPAAITDLFWQDGKGAAQDVFYLDDIEFLPNANTTPPAENGPALSIDMAAQRHTISDDIYGMNFPDETLAYELRLPVARWGGNATSRYNWQTSMRNITSDWFFENVVIGTVDTALLPNNSASDQFIEQNLRTGTKSIITLPLIGWTTKASSPRTHPYDCAFKVSKYGQQQATDFWDSNCGNGKYTNGSLLTGNDPTDTSTTITTSFVSNWISHLKSNYGTAVNQGVRFYNLDNEPMLWKSTHRDIHPNAVTYDEIGNLTASYAAAIKVADSSAKTLGPVLWGWCAYFYSAADGCSAGTDYSSHGNKAFVAWYLEQMRDYETQHGVRILDYLDLHFYPQQTDVALSTAGNAATQALRLRSTRSLWDNAYVDESWISDLQSGGTVARLIPRMRDWVTTYYPGTKLAITEYNWGGLENINGALTQADVLGIFGREALDLATIWDAPTTMQPGAFAFRIYRNYDGLKNGFGDTSVQASSADQGVMSVYAAQRTADNALTVMVINKTANELTSALSIAGLTLPATAEVYRYSASNLNAIVKQANQAVTGTSFSAAFPANSITLFVLKSGISNNPTLTISKTGTGSGTVTPDTGIINWTGSTGIYNFIAPVTLTATAATGSTLNSWTGCDSTQGNSCILTTVASKSVAAQFTLNTHQLTANATGTGSATIVSSTKGINFSYPSVKTGTESVSGGSSLSLSASALNGSVVTWSGDCSVINGALCSISNMNASKIVNLTATACTYSISPTSKSFTRAGGSGTIAVTASSTLCRWTASSNASWLTVPYNFIGSQTVSYTVAANTRSRTRKATISVAGKSFTVTQEK